ncbi:hypothetical protein TGPRC2_219730 [Toxoplasma gondii TgCatPRC2]|uniref:Uncharacterized protein n=1 Tax=Toxoplasma gondii TgCatPRC2 TaxID=1130821 RepID=A0A151HD36_TOXGO|nr:hypothetical protein TGPRC2_219730 [Toxoplasma gondii TgCatPRC2]
MDMQTIPEGGCAAASLLVRRRMAPVYNNGDNKDVKIPQHSCIRVICVAASLILAFGVDVGLADHYKLRPEPCSTEAPHRRRLVSSTERGANGELSKSRRVLLFGRVLQLTERHRNGTTGGVAPRRLAEASHHPGEMEQLIGELGLTAIRDGGSVPHMSARPMTSNGTPLWPPGQNSRSRIFRRSGRGQDHAASSANMSTERSESPRHMIFPSKFPLPPDLQSHKDVLHPSCADCQGREDLFHRVLSAIESVRDRIDALERPVVSFTETQRFPVTQEKGVPDRHWASLEGERYLPLGELRGSIVTQETAGAKHLTESKHEDMQQKSDRLTSALLYNRLRLLKQRRDSLFDFIKEENEADMAAQQALQRELYRQQVMRNWQRAHGIQRLEDERAELTRLLQLSTTARANGTGMDDVRRQRRLQEVTMLLEHPRSFRRAPP